jgi:hypothetical protein
MKLIKNAFKVVDIAEEQLREVIAQCCPVGSIITYKHGCHAIEAEVVSTGGISGCGTMWVRGVKSGREYTLHPYRIESVA